MVERETQRESESRDVLLMYKCFLRVVLIPSYRETVFSPGLIPSNSESSAITVSMYNVDKLLRCHMNIQEMLSKDVQTVAQVIKDTDKKSNFVKLS